MTEGRIHSVETFGTVDGPGIRFVIFFQGCSMRCLYCHNPDTWDPKGGTLRTAESLLEEYERGREFYRGGGITATGGEPLLQLAFLTELFFAAKKRGIHTCLDTSGIVYRKSRQKEFEELFRVTDLVLLDIKHSFPGEHEKLTGQKQSHVLEFADALESAGVPVVIRHVAVPGITDSKEQLTALGHLIGKWKNVKGLEVLPYHSMGIPKYESLGLEYPLRSTRQMEQEEAAEARRIILKGLEAARKNPENLH